MRLTLRTLLAYLDNTLDPQDAEALREKLGESGFATQLVQRIRDTLASKSLAAPSPQAVGPVEEANVISEYLDSTLASEQMAEIERACLESDPHLAEAAACHQILTMVLGQPAQVPPELRQRIYELPEKNIEEIAAASGSFSSLSIPDQPALGSLQDVIPTADAGGESSHGGKPVTPVGITDSGVSDAPTRLREAGVVADRGRGEGGPAMAGSKPRSLENASGLYGGSIRTSRITPWIVSLALAAVLLFALSQIFSPLLNQGSVATTPDPNVIDTTGDDPDASEQSAIEIEVPAEEAPPLVEVESNETSNEVSNETSNGIPNEASTEPDSSATEGDPDSPAPEVLPTPTPTAEQPEVDGTTEPGSVEMPAEPVEDPAKAATVPEDPTAEVAAEPSAPTVAVVEELMPEKAGTDKVAAADNAADPAVADKPPVIEIARVTSENSLLAASINGMNWLRLKKDMPVGEGWKVVAAPTFRGKLKSKGNVQVTMVGPTQIQWLGTKKLQVDYGRVLLQATEGEVSIDLVLGDHPVKLALADIESVAGISVKHFRAAGFDPIAEENRIPLAGVLAVQGEMELTSENIAKTLATGQQWVKRGKTAPKITPVEIVPSWVDPPDPTEPTLESGAREGLLALLAGDQTLDLSLREATAFRKAEVGALAAQTLLILGRGDVYFGGDGILSQPSQRAYWPDHYRLLLEMTNQSAEKADELNRSIAKMDSANADAIQRLLTGYSQKQLVEGGDEELIEFLDSPSMAVRVLALEHLHNITGTTLYFRAEESNAIRRATGIKKWQVRQRKGDIRWQE